VVKDIELSDIWREAATSQQRSLALRLWLQGRDATLEDRQVEHCVQSLLDALTETHGARLRS
jgi:phenylalanyl-tRNA synthetase beta chain